MSDFINTSDLNRSRYRQLIRETGKGNFIRLKNGVYSTPEGLLSTMPDIEKIIPHGILCLYSAWAYHRLCTQIPDAIYVAIANKRNVKIPKFPNIKLIYVSDSILNLGTEYKKVDDYKVSIYDIERCVCDAIKYRNKIGLDVMAEILNNYLSRPGRDIKKLTEYAVKLRVSKTLNNYLAVKL